LLSNEWLRLKIVAGIIRIAWSREADLGAGRNRSTADRDLWRCVLLPLGDLDGRIFALIATLAYYNREGIDKPHQETFLVRTWASVRGGTVESSLCNRSILLCLLIDSESLRKATDGCGIELRQLGHGARGRRWRGVGYGQAVGGAVEEGIESGL
jgi:hypothetical protein